MELRKQRRWQRRDRGSTGPPSRCGDSLGRLHLHCRQQQSPGSGGQSGWIRLTFHVAADLVGSPETVPLGSSCRPRTSREGGNPAQPRAVDHPSPARPGTPGRPPHVVPAAAPVVPAPPPSFPRRREPSATASRGPPKSGTTRNPWSPAPRRSHGRSRPVPARPLPFAPRSREGGNPAQPRPVDHPSSPATATLGRPPQVVPAAPSVVPANSGHPALASSPLGNPVGGGTGPITKASGKGTGSSVPARRADG